MTDPTQRARVRAAIAHSTGKTVDTLTDAVMAALAEPTPEPRRVELDGTRFATWVADDDGWEVHNDVCASYWTNATGIVGAHVGNVGQRDAKVLELLALRDGADAKDVDGKLMWLFTHCRAIGMTDKSDSGAIEHDIALFTTALAQRAEAAKKENAENFEARRQQMMTLLSIYSGEAYRKIEAQRDKAEAELLALRGDAKPTWWVNERDSIAATFAYDTEADAIRTSKQNPGVNYTRIAVPVYEYPPVPRAPQSETREVIGYAVLRDGHVVTWLHESKTLEQLREATMLHAKHEGGTVVELLRGADVPLVRAERAP